MVKSKTMPKPYSSDIRRRVINCFKKGMKHQDISNKLDISLSTVRRYSVRYKTLGNVDVKNNIKTGRKGKINNIKDLQQFIRENNNLSLIDMAYKWGNISKSALHRAIISAGFSFKKSHGYIKKEMKS